MIPGINIISGKAGIASVRRSWRVWGFCKPFSSGFRGRIMKQMTKPVCPFGTMPQESWHPGKGAKPDHVIELNCGELHTHITRTWNNFSNQGTKKVLLSDELRLIANNSKSFAIGNNSIIRNNLGLSKCSETNLI